MTVLAKPLINSKTAEVAQTTQYTTPQNTRTVIDKFSGTNTSGAVQSITVNIVPSGGAAGATNIITATKAIQAGEAYNFPELVGQVLNPGDFISTLTTAAVINIRASGREVT